MCVEVENGKIILEGVFSVFGRTSYPGRIYGMYVWNESKDMWEISQDWKGFDIKMKRRPKLEFILSHI